MENIIKKAIEGGYKITPSIWGKPYLEYCTNLTARFRFPVNSVRQNAYTVRIKEIVLDNLLWKSLSKSCDWSGDGDEWMFQALRFHEINLTEGWDKAVSYLEDLIKNNE